MKEQGRFKGPMLYLAAAFVAVLLLAAGTVWLWFRVIMELVSIPLG